MPFTQNLVGKLLRGWRTPSFRHWRHKKLRISDAEVLLHTHELEYASNYLASLCFGLASWFARNLIESGLDPQSVVLYLFLTIL